jgi:hypothetical protein
MTISTRSTGAAAPWVTIVTLIVLIVAGYFAWPQMVLYWDNTSVRAVVKSKATFCLPYKGGTPEICKPKMIEAIKAETGIIVDSQDLHIQTAGKKATIRCRYKTKLKYPFTGNLLGSDKDRFKVYNWTMVVESKYVL